MDLVLLVARLLLAAVFAVAGLAKLADLSGSRQAVRDFGLPSRLAAPLGTLLPLAELGVAVALVPEGEPVWAPGMDPFAVVPAPPDAPSGGDGQEPAAASDGQAEPAGEQVREAEAVLEARTG